MEKFFVEHNNVPVIHMEFPWHFKDEWKKDIDTMPVLFHSETEQKEKVDFLYHIYKDEKNNITAKRIYVKCGANTVFIVDVIQSEKDICVYTDFTAHNTDYSLSCNVADKNKLVLRNSECAIKHFRLFSQLDGNCIMDKTGLMMPYKIKKGGDVSYSMYEGLYGYGKEHISCFGFCSDTLDNIAAWHFIETENGYVAEPPSKKDSWQICFDCSCVKIYLNSICEAVFSLS